MRLAAKSATFLLMTLSGVVSPAVAQACPPGARQIVSGYQDWLDEVDSATAVNAFRELQNFQAESERLGRALLDLDTGNMVLSRYRDILAEIDRQRGAEAGSRAFEDIFGAIRRAGNSLTAASECLALVPVDVPDAFSVSLAGAFLTTRYIDAEMMLATDAIDAALRSDAPLTDREGQELFAALGEVGRFSEVSGGVFTECLNQIAGAPTRGLRGLSAEWAMSTVGDAMEACGAALPSEKPEMQCNSEIAFALDWVEGWQADARQEKMQELNDLRLALTDMGNDIQRVGGPDFVFANYAVAIEELKALRQQRRPDVAPEDLDRALVNRIDRNVREAQELADPMAACIAAAVPTSARSADDIALGAALLLDTFFSPDTGDWVEVIRAAFSGAGPKDRDGLVALMNAMEANSESFMGLSGGNRLRCRSLMEQMMSDPSFQFRLRNRRDSENSMRILSLPQSVVAVPISEWKAKCGG